MRWEVKINRKLVEFGREWWEIEAGKALIGSSSKWDKK